ncbi:MAG: hypothetical protein KKF80_07400 [Candidatus Omnitrophica bacterium]|nr:hypothetical protein [Candidatus Omnitrophota bacterium]
MSRLRGCVGILLVVVGILGYLGNATAKPIPLNLLPPSTELIEEKQEDQAGLSIFKFKFRSTSSKREILSFYRTMFANEGFQEVQATPEKKNPEQNTFFFTRGNQMILMHFVKVVDEGVATYYIHAHEAGPVRAQ